jgi:gas vesicle structural protein
MARRPKQLPSSPRRSNADGIARRAAATTVSAQVLDVPDTTVLDLLDNLLNKGVLLNGDVTLGVAGIDLIYLRLSTLLCAADRIFGDEDYPVPARGRRSRSRRPRPLKRRT